MPGSWNIDIEGSRYIPYFFVFELYGPQYHTIIKLTALSLPMIRFSNEREPEVSILSHFVEQTKNYKTKFTDEQFERNLFILLSTFQITEVKTCNE